MSCSRLSHRDTVLRALRSLSRERCQHNPKPARRRIHNVPQLEYDSIFTQQGVGKVFSPQAYDVAWHQYQAHLVARLNELTSGRNTGTQQTRNILLANARNPSKAALFNHASMAWNNHHFFSTLSPTPLPVSDSLEQRLSGSFSSLESFKAQFLATALSMFGPGFVWLIRNPSSRAYLPLSRTAGNPANDPEFTILCTYIAGSPLPGAHPRVQSVDMNTENALTATNNALPSAANTNANANSPSDNINSPPAPGTPLMNAPSPNAPTSLGTTAHSPGRMLRAEVCLGVNTWEHCYLHDHGVSRAGKQRYLEKWWESIDWSVVEKNAVLDPMRGDDPEMIRSRAAGQRLPRVGL